MAELGPWEPDKIPKCCLGDPAMADEHYIVMTVECQRCKTKQKVRERCVKCILQGRVRV